MRSSSEGKEALEKQFKNGISPGIVALGILEPGKQRQEDHEFKASQGYIVRLCLKMGEVALCSQRNTAFFLRAQVTKNVLGAEVGGCTEECFSYRDARSHVHI